MKTQNDILKEAEDIHFTLMDIEESLEKKEDEELFDKHFELSMEIADLMRDYIHSKFMEKQEEAKKSKVYFDIPGAKDFYSESVGRVEVDPDIAEAVRVLNEKGYETFASCSGHIAEKFANGETRGYIWMSPKPAKIPKGLYWFSSSIRWIAKTESSLNEKHKLLLQYVKSLGKV